MRYMSEATLWAGHNSSIEIAPQHQNNKNDLLPTENNTYPSQNNDDDDLHDNKAKREDQGLLPPTLDLGWVAVFSCPEPLNSHVLEVFVGALQEQVQDAHAECCVQEDV